MSQPQEKTPSLSNLEFCNESPSLSNCYFRFDNLAFDIPEMMTKLEPYTSHNLPVMRTTVKGVDRLGEPYVKHLENVYPSYDEVINRKKVVVQNEDGTTSVVYKKTNCIHSEITIFIESENDERLRLSGNPNPRTKRYFYKVKVSKSNGTVQVPGVKDPEFKDMIYVENKLKELFAKVGYNINRWKDDNGNPNLTIITLNIIAGLQKKKYIVDLLALKKFLKENPHSMEHQINICSKVNRTISGLEFEIEYTGKDRDVGSKPQKILLWQTGKYQLYRCMHVPAQLEIISWVKALFTYLYSNTDVINDLQA